MIPARGQLGFTLGETLAALAVVGISLSLAVPALQSLTRSDHLAVSVNQLVGTMHIARSEAVTRNARVTVCASTDGASCEGNAWERGWIAFLDADANAEHAPSEELFDRVDALTAIAVRSAELGGAFTYRPNGQVSTATQTPAGGEFSFCEPQAIAPARVVILRTSGVPALSANPGDRSHGLCPRDE